MRCGWCCWNFSVRLPDGQLKPELQFCPYLERRKIEGNKWIEASCKIHNSPEYPRECRDAIFSPFICPFGIGIWKAEKKAHPQVKLPPLAEKALELFEILSSNKK